MDKISIKGLEVYASHGCMAQEKAMGQKFLINVTMQADLHFAKQGDDLSHSVDYSEVSDRLSEWMKADTYNLIETVADVLAGKLLLNYPQIREVSVEVEKPQAPLKCHFETVMVRVEKKRHSVYLGLGSNIGERIENIENALKMLDEREDVKLLECSSLYETRAYGVKDQPNFINACARIETFLEPHHLLKVLQDTENRMGRKRELRWGPRNIDLDILLFDDCIIDTKDLHIPHIDMKNRIFVLKPLSEIAGFYRHPCLKSTVDEMLAELTEKDSSVLADIMLLEKL